MLFSTLYTSTQSSTYLLTLEISEPDVCSKNCGAVQYDIKNHKVFLKRVAYPALTLEQLYIGSTILVYTRQLFIEDYGDEFTRKHLQGLQEM